MSVKIRLRRTGSNRNPSFRIIVTDSRKATVGGRLIETIGWYDPKVGGDNYKLEVDRLEHWKKHGAHVSDTVRALLKRSRQAADKAPAPAPAAPAAPATPDAPAAS